MNWIIYVDMNKPETVGQLPCRGLFHPRADVLWLAAGVDLLAAENLWPETGLLGADGGFLGADGGLLRADVGLLGADVGLPGANVLWPKTDVGLQ
jgi:hypothetical protein